MNMENIQLVTFVVKYYTNNIGLDGFKFHVL